MNRREFITLLGGAAAWPLAARAQPRGKPARIGYLSASSPPDNTLESFLAGMRALGYGEGRDFVVEVRYAGRDYSRFPALVEEPRRRAWLRIFVVRCGLPCDPPVGGHSCNGGMISRFSEGRTMLLRCERLEPPVSSDGSEASNWCRSQHFRFTPHEPT